MSDKEFENIWGEALTQSHNGDSQSLGLSEPTAIADLFPEGPQKIVSMPSGKKPKKGRRFTLADMAIREERELSRGYFTEEELRILHPYSFEREQQSPTPSPRAAEVELDTDAEPSTKRSRGQVLFSDAERQVIRDTLFPNYGQAKKKGKSARIPSFTAKQLIRMSVANKGRPFGQIWSRVMLANGCDELQTAKSFRSCLQSMLKKRGK